jgi:type IV secretory pathway VirB10-like protein
MKKLIGAFAAVCMCVVVGFGTTGCQKKDNKQVTKETVKETMPKEKGVVKEVVGKEKDITTDKPAKEAPTTDDKKPVGDVPPPKDLPGEKAPPKENGKKTEEKKTEEKKTDDKKTEEKKTEEKKEEKKESSLRVPQNFLALLQIESLPVDAFRVEAQVAYNRTGRSYAAVTA